MQKQGAANREKHACVVVPDDPSVLELPKRALPLRRYYPDLEEV